jgi:2-methylcitrate dehydratase PrpD
MSSSVSAVLANWAVGLRREDMPPDIVTLTRQRILDIIGVGLTGVGTAFGDSVHEAVGNLGAGAESTVLGYGSHMPANLAALANGALAHEFEFDDTHNETAIHVSSPVVVTALAVGERLRASGADVLAAVAAGNEVVCRIGVIAPGEFYKSGFHPTGIVGTFGATVTACKLMGLDAAATTNALGIAGSMTSGSMESWSDGASAKSLHPGWSAHAAITAATLAAAGVTGPVRVLEGRLGFFHQHVRDAGYPFDYDRARNALGERWESRLISFKPYPTGHVAHAFIDAALQLRAEGLRPEQIERVICPIAAFMVQLMCEPVAEKLRPATTWHARVSLPFTLAEAFIIGKVDAESFSAERLADPRLLEFARRVEYRVDETAPGREQWRGWVIAELRDGTRRERIQPYNWGSPQNPLSQDDVEAKFRANSVPKIGSEKAEAVIRRLRELESERKISAIMELCIR